MGDEFAGFPYKYDSIVRVVGVGDKELDGHLMTVVGFDRGDASDQRNECGVVLLQRRGTVVRVSPKHVYTVLD